MRRRHYNRQAQDVKKSEFKEVSTISGYENIFKPSALSEQQKTADALKAAKAGGSRGGERAEKINKDAERNCEKKLGHSPEKETQTMSPNATNISHG